MGSPWRQRALLPGLCICIQLLQLQPAKPYGEKNLLKWKKKSVCSSFRERLQGKKLLSNCFKSCAGCICTVQKKVFSWAEWGNKLNLGGDEMHFRRLPKGGNEVKLGWKTAEGPDWLLNFPNKNQSQTRVSNPEFIIMLSWHDYLETSLYNMRDFCCSGKMVILVTGWKSPPPRPQRQQKH